jgi:hypothetical protein
MFLGGYVKKQNFLGARLNEKIHEHQTLTIFDAR